MSLQLVHANFGWLHAPPLPPACCHGLILRNEKGIVLVDTGIGRHDIAAPLERIGREAIEAAGFQFLPKATGIHQIEQLGHQASDVTDIVLTHGDPDHAGGLADFPHARIHVAAEELRNLESGNPRYRAAQFAHGPQWQTYAENDATWCDLPARRVATALQAEILLIPLFGHTHGHCGVAIHTGSRWSLHVGDAYYLRAELENPQHPVDQLAELRADDDALRRQSLATLRRLTQTREVALDYCGYHDVTELPPEISNWAEINAS
jgi:glyoxylase-like metal-dependent hydrolase (beta-lactamase superfamily II)